MPHSRWHRSCAGLIREVAPGGPRKRAQSRYSALAIEHRTGQLDDIERRQACSVAMIAVSRPSVSRPIPMLRPRGPFEGRELAGSTGELSAMIISVEPAGRDDTNN